MELIRVLTTIFLIMGMLVLGVLGVIAFVGMHDNTKKVTRLSLCCRGQSSTRTFSMKKVIDTGYFGGKYGSHRGHTLACFTLLISTCYKAHNQAFKRNIQSGAFAPQILTRRFGTLRTLRALHLSA